MADVKAAAAKPSSSQAGKPKNANNFLTNLLVVLPCIVAGVLIYNFVLGSSGNFQDAERLKPKPGNIMATMYSGGIVVPVLLATLLTLLCFVIERALTVI